MISRRDVLRAAPALVAASATGSAFAQSSYPNRPIRIIVCNAPGGTDDLISRTIAKKMMSELGQPVVVENRGGGSTTIGAAAAAAAAPDGYTILCLISAGINQTALRDKLPYTLNSFVPLVGVGGFPLALAVGAESKIKTMDDLKALAKTADGVKYSTGGVGTMAHLTTARFLKAAQGHGLNVAFKNNPEGLNALMAGLTDMMFASESEIAPLKNGGKVRALAVTSAHRASSMPDVPTTRELGLASLDPMLWHGYMAPAGTPADIVAKLSSAITKGIKDPEFQNLLKPMGFQEDLKTGDALKQYIFGEAARAREVIVENKITIND